LYLIKNKKKPSKHGEYAASCCRKEEEERERAKKRMHTATTMGLMLQHAQAEISTNACRTNRSKKSPAMSSISRPRGNEKEREREREREGEREGAVPYTSASHFPPCLKHRPRALALVVHPSLEHGFVRRPPCLPWYDFIIRKRARERARARG
jgi:hypothetical protein